MEHQLLIDENNALRSENQLLWETVDVLRRVAGAEPLPATSTPVDEWRQHEPPPSPQRRSNGRHNGVAVATEPSDPTDIERFEAAIHQLVDQLARTTDVMAEQHSEPLVEQMKCLNDEIERLREEIQAMHRRHLMSVLITRDNTWDGTGPRLRPIRPGATDLIIDASEESGIWRRLRRPWFYLPLVWGTVVVILLLAGLLMFFD